MSNPLYSILGGNQQPNNGMANMLRDFQTFKNSFRGDPRAEVQRLLNTGQMTQAQYTQLSQMANQILGALK